MLKWQCPTGEKWQRFALGDIEMNRPEMENHLETCPQCQFVLAQINNDLNGLKTVWDESATQDVIYLSPMSYNTLSGEPAQIKLAAQGVQKEAEPDAVVLVSDDKEIVLRVVRDAHTKEVWLYIVAEKPELYENVLIKFPHTKKEFLTDYLGRMNIGTVNWSKTELTGAEIRLPKAKFILNPIEPFTAGEAIELSTSGGDRIRIVLHKQGRNNRLEIQILDTPNGERATSSKIAIRAEETNKLVQIQQVVSDRVSFDGFSLAKKIELYLYQ
ncbi:MAG: hypothetical protein R3F48_08395 [Candidatus Zixiibacteriota bacterium]